MNVNRALISVSDKKNVDIFVKGLSELGIKIISTGGTASFLKNAGLKINDI